MAGVGSPVSGGFSPGAGMTQVSQNPIAGGGTQTIYSTPTGMLVAQNSDGQGNYTWWQGQTPGQQDWVPTSSPASTNPYAGLQSLQQNSPQVFSSQTPAQQAASQAVLAPQAQLPVSDYVNEVTQSLQPTFTQNEQALTENLAGEGILNSGAASNQLQNLQGQDNATIAGLVAPLLAQGNAQQQQTNLTNAGAQNSAIQQANQLSETTGLAQNQNNNALQLAQLGYSNQDYQSLLNAIYGITGNGQAAANQIGVGLPGGSQGAYQSGATAGAAGASGLGNAIGYGMGAAAGTPAGGVGVPVPGNTGSTNDSSAGTGYYDPNGVEST